MQRIASHFVGQLNACGASSSSSSPELVRSFVEALDALRGTVREMVERVCVRDIARQRWDHTQPPHSRDGRPSAGVVWLHAFVGALFDGVRAQLAAAAASSARVGAAVAGVGGGDAQRLFLAAALDAALSAVTDAYLSIAPSRARTAQFSVDCFCTAAIGVCALRAAATSEMLPAPLRPAPPALPHSAATPAPPAQTAAALLAESYARNCVCLAAHLVSLAALRVCPAAAVVEALHALRGGSAVHLDVFENARTASLRGGEGSRDKEGSTPNPPPPADHYESVANRVVRAFSARFMPAAHQSGAEMRWGRVWDNAGMGPAVYSAISAPSLRLQDIWADLTRSSAEQAKIHVQSPSVKGKETDTVPALFVLFRGTLSNESPPVVASTTSVASPSSSSPTGAAEAVDSGSSAAALVKDKLPAATPLDDRSALSEWLDLLSCPLPVEPSAAPQPPPLLSSLGTSRGETRVVFNFSRHEMVTAVRVRFELLGDAWPALTPAQALAAASLRTALPPENAES